MKKFALLTLAAALTAPTVLSQMNPHWENPEVFQLNQVAPHATLMPYDDHGEALKGDRKSSVNHFSLNGMWDFQWSENPDDSPDGFYNSSYNRGDWHQISVPSNWQMEGFGYPLFRNIGLPHPLEPPLVPRDFNPVGSYYRTFTLPANWKEKQIFLHFEGVHSASYVWVNGEEVGYNQGGMDSI
jgi:beta-galactosidase